MPTSPKPTGQQETKTLVWFEQEIVAHTPQVGILDGVSLGCLSISQFAGQLAGEWKDHRILMHDLHTEQVATTLGELLGAVVQMAHAVGVSLEFLAEQQVQRVRAAPTGAHHRKTMPVAVPAKTASVGEERVAVTRPARGSKGIMDQEPPTKAASRRRRALTSPDKASPPATTKPARSAARSSRTPRSVSTDVPPVTATRTRAESLPTSKRRQRRAAATSTTVQPTLFAGDTATKRRRQSAAAGAKQT